jgi:membrane associated rhomboid family serine protease
MGIYDRDYYRETSGYLSFDKRFQACTILALLYVCFFVFQAVRDGKVNRLQHGSLTERLELNASKVLDGELWRVITYAFVHDPANIVPIVVNVIFLISFGRQLENLHGWKEFLAYYLLSGFLAGLGFTLAATVFRSDGALLGPVGSITAALVLFALRFPHRSVQLFFVLPCRIWVLLALYLIINVAWDGTLNLAVIGAEATAAAFALFCHRYSLRVANWLPRMQSSSIRPPNRPRLQIFGDEAADGEAASLTASGSTASASYASAHTPSTTPATAAHVLLDEHLEAKLDEVLKKVNLHGQNSLTDEERAVLFRASEIYRKRRKT